MYICVVQAQGRSIRDDYQIQKRIGQGNYSTVHLAVHRRTREKVAVKIAKKANLTQEDIDAVYVEVDVLREVRLRPTCLAETICVHCVLWPVGSPTCRQAQSVL